MNISRRLNRLAELVTEGSRLADVGTDHGYVPLCLCREKKIPVMIAFEGYGAAGKGLQIGNLIQALDPRGFKVYAVKNETEEEWMHPFMWRFWTKIPEKGRIAIFDTSWYRRVMIERFEGKTPEKELEKDFASIRAFEKQLTDDGMVIIKLFLKIDRKEQKKRFEKLLASKDTAWRVSKGDLKRNHDFKEYKAINEEMLRKTDADYAPWTVINATKKKEAKVAVYQAVIQAMEEAVARKELEEKGQPADFATVLADIRQRDYQDTHRAIAPLKQADDAILVDTSDIGFDESFELLKRTILAHI